MPISSFAPPAGESLQNAITDLKSFLGGRASISETVREHHSHGESYHTPAPPDVVCFPHSTEEVSEILKVSARYKVPVVPFGAGSSLEAQVNAVCGGISIDMREMNKILSVTPEDLTVTLEAGVSRLQLNKALANTGLAFFVDPGADCTIGGMASTRASGTTTVRYGTIRDYVMALTVVLADGRVIHTGTRARKSAAGYDLTRMFVGAEGTLGVITELTLRLYPLPEAVLAASCSFETIQGAVETAIETIQGGVPVARMELLDVEQTEASNRLSKINFSVAPTLLFEFHGDTARGVNDQSETVQQISQDHGGREFRWFRTTEEREALWKARHEALPACLATRPGSKAFVTDICVPISRLAECILLAKKEVAGAPFPAMIIGHVGDGNFHMNFAIDPANPDEHEEACRVEDKIILLALRLGGTCSGEHGVGYGRIKYLEAEHGAAFDVMRAIKQALDPDNRMNPGKMVEPRLLFSGAAS